MTVKDLGIDAYPLAWPEGWKRTAPALRHSSRYQVSLAQARDDLVDDLAKLSDPTNVVISTNVPTRRDGLPYANHPEPADPGVAAYWIDRAGRQRVIACDAWQTVRENMRAVGIAVASLRSIERSKASEILDRAFVGFAALPPKGNHWRSVLDLPPSGATLDEAEAAYRRLAALHHPDRGGSHERMAQLNQAIAEARTTIGA
jgi:hypothetical protein